MSVPLTGLKAIGDLLQRQPLNAQTRSSCAKSRLIHLRPDLHLHREDC